MLACAMRAAEALNGMMRIGTMAAIGLWLAASPAPAQPIDDPAAHARSRTSDAPSPSLALEAGAPELLLQFHIASISVAVLKEGRIVYTQAWGQASPSEPATPQTLYNVASLAKPVSAEVAMRLVSSGSIALDESMSAYWIDPDVAGDSRAARLTPRFVMSHRTGLPNWRADDGGVLRFDHEPGEIFGYSGEGFEWLARFVERKTGEPFETLAQNLIFTPSGMNDTAYTRRPWFAGRLAMPYDANLIALPQQIADHYIASDDLISTPSDYARFIIGLLHRQGLTSALYLERQKVQAARSGHACVVDAATPCATEDGFGLGWESILIDGRRFLMHTGMDDGTFTFAYMEPETGEGLVMFTNSSNGWQAVLPVLQMTDTDEAFVQHLRRAAS